MFSTMEDAKLHYDMLTAVRDGKRSADCLDDLPEPKVTLKKSGGRPKSAPLFEQETAVALVTKAGPRHAGGHSGGRWSSAEDATLRSMLATTGRSGATLSHAKMADQMPGRTKRAVSSRINHLRR
jgi:hypothetical protein